MPISDPSSSAEVVSALARNRNKLKESLSLWLPQRVQHHQTRHGMVLAVHCYREPLPGVVPDEEERALGADFSQNVTPFL